MLADRLKMGAAGVEAADGGNDSYTKLLMHMEGTDDAQVFTDSSVGNLVKIDSGGLGDGFGVFNGTDAYLSVADSADWTLGDTFTIELWVKFDSATGDKVFVSQETNADNRWMFYWLSTGVLRWYDRIGGGNNIVDSDAWTPILGQWYHIALSKNGTKAYFFIDGVDSGDPNDASAVQNLTEDLIIGMNESNSAADNFFPGSMDELRISNVARYTEAFTPSTTAFTSDANTKLLLHMDLPNTDPQSFVDSGNTTHTVTDNGGVYQKATDLGIIGTSCGYFDGVEAALTLLDSTDWDIIQAGNFTIDFWIKFNSHAGGDMLFKQRQDSTHAWMIEHAHGSGIRLKVVDGGTIIDFYGGEIEDNDWHHIALVKNSTRYDWYIDGVSTANTTDADVATFAGSVSIGAEASGTGGLDGYIDDLRLTNGTAVYTANFNPPTTALTNIANTKLLLHFDNGEGSVAFDDDSTPDHTVTPVGNAIQVIGHGADAVADVKTEDTQKKFGTTSAYFDGTGDYIKLSKSTNWDFGDGDFTIDGWFYPTASSGTYRLISYQNGGAGYWMLQWNRTVDGSITWQCSGDDPVYTTYDAGITVNDWYHFAVIRNGNAFNVYLDGTSVISLDYTGITMASGVSGLYIGCYSDGSNEAYEGYIDELRISKGIARWTANFTPPTRAYY